MGSSNSPSRKIDEPNKSKPAAKPTKPVKPVAKPNGSSNSPSR